MKRALATIAASTIALVGFAPAANAQLFDAFNGADAIIAGVPCHDLDTVLKSAGLKNNDTTRNQLARNLQGYTTPAAGGDLIFTLLGSQYSGKIADRALQCGIVKADPKELIPGSSQFAPLLESLSSTVSK